MPARLTRRARRRPGRSGALVLALALLWVLVAAPGSASAASQRGAVPQHAVHYDVSPPLRDIPAASGAGSRAYPARPTHARTPTNASPSAGLQDRFGASAAPTAGIGFLGLGNGFTGFTVNSAPPDPAGAVGPSNYVQLVNQGLAVFDKSGALVLGPEPTNTLWSGFGGRCQSDNDGDGTVEYDRAANRFVVTQFAVSGASGSVSNPYLECVAVSKTGDPTGQYYRYAFPYSQFPDYPKLGVWPDAYYTTFNMFGNTFLNGKVCAYDRTRMLSGLSATQQCFDTPSESLLPSDADSAPPAGAPNYLVALDDSTHVGYWTFHVDWATPANSTFSGPTSLTVDSYSEACGGDASCIPQSGSTAADLDSLGDRLMYRLAYRNFGAQQSLVVNHSVVADTSVGVRWYELRVGSGNSLSVFQQGTYAPDTAYRWMGSAAMDKNGNIAIGYSTSSSSLHPSIRYTGRLAGDAAGQMTQGEGTLFTGPGSQTGGLNRWGDYSTLTIDPSDGCTFWYVNEYLPANGSFNWSTRIGTFSLSGCATAAAPPPRPAGVSATSSDASVSLTWSASAGATSYKVYRGTSAGGEDGSPVGTPTGTSFTDTGRTNGTAYYYKVAAVGPTGESATSSEVHATPVATPGGVTATPGNGSVSLNWSPAAGATGYKVYRGTSPGGEGATAVASPSGTSFNDTGRTNGQPYYYEITGTNPTGESPRSVEVSATPQASPPPPPPAAPTSLTATAGDGQVSLSWPAVSGATGYKIYRSLTSGTEGGSPIATPTGTSFTNTGLTNGQTYYYKVAATNGSGDSQLSPEAHATPQATTQQPPPQQPPPTTTTSPPTTTTTTQLTTTSLTPISIAPGIPPLDTTPPTLTLKGVAGQKLANVLKKGVALDLSCSEQCTLAVALLIDFKTAHAVHLAAKPVKVGGRTIALTRGGHVRVRVPLSSRAKKRLKHVRKLKLKVQVAGTDSSGNRSTKTSTLSLH